MSQGEVTTNGEDDELKIGKKEKLIIFGKRENMVKDLLSREKKVLYLCSSPFRAFRMSRCFERDGALGLQRIIGSELSGSGKWAFNCEDVQDKKIIVLEDGDFKFLKNYPLLAWFKPALICYDCVEESSSMNANIHQLKEMHALYAKTAMLNIFILESGIFSRQIFETLKGIFKVENTLYMYSQEMVSDTKCQYFPNLIKTGDDGRVELWNQFQNEIKRWGTKLSEMYGPRFGDFSAIPQEDCSTLSFETMIGDALIFCKHYNLGEFADIFAVMMNLVRGMTLLRFENSHAAFEYMDHYMNNVFAPTKDLKYIQQEYEHWKESCTVPTSEPVHTFDFLYLKIQHLIKNSLNGQNVGIICPSISLDFLLSELQKNCPNITIVSSADYHSSDHISCILFNEFGPVQFPKAFNSVKHCIHLARSKTCLKTWIPCFSRFPNHQFHEFFYWEHTIQITGKKRKRIPSPLRV